MYFYSAYGLGVRSTLPLPEFLPAEAGCDLYIKVDGNGHTPTEAAACPWHFEVTPEKAVLFFQDVGTFVIRQGREITVIPQPDVDERLIRIYIVGTVMGVALYQRGMLVLHASTVEVDGGAVAFVGTTGAGKSTAVATLHAHGHGFVADDISAVSLERGAALVMPAFPQMKLTPKMAATLGYDPESLIPLHPREEKHAHRVTHGFSQAPVPLRCIYILEKAAEPSIERSSPQQSVIELVRHTFPTRMLQPGGISHLRQCAYLANTVPMFRLKRPLDVQALSDFIGMVEQHLAGDLWE